MILRLLIAILFSVPVMGQNYTLKTIPVRNEINTNLITSEPFIDKDGFPWYAVNMEGIFYKYDGRNQVLYSLFNNNKKQVNFSTSSIYNWIQCRNGNILAINLVGIYIINQKTSQIKYIKWNVQNLELRDFNYVSSVEDKNGNIWISIAENYIIKLNPKYQQKIYRIPQHSLKKRFSRKGQNIIDTETAPLKIIKLLKDGRILLKSYSNFYIIDENGMHKLNLIEKPHPNIHFVDNGLLFKRNTSGKIIYNNKCYNYRYIKDLDIQIFECPYNNFIYIKSFFFAVKNNEIYILAFNKEKNIFSIK
ncbi:hypothetical protein, partial [Flavobacterium sp. A45]|uniref:hypothetical protein n=1 Tax=Flavobacterium sp. A45 TaxID=1945862 RepID=UPI0009C4421F